MNPYESFALAGALALGTLACLHALVWHAQRQPWSAMFALGLAALTVVFAFDSALRPVGEEVALANTLLSATSLVLMTLGILGYVQVPPPWRARLAGFVIAVAALLVALRIGEVFGRQGGRIAYATYMGLMAALLVWARLREPHRGHGLVLLAILTYPAAVWLARRGSLDPGLVRYAIIVPTVVLGMTVLTTGMLRAQRRADEEIAHRTAAEAALRELNDSLEQRVARRTSELGEMVTGLESFNRSVSHDLRGPLGGIAGAARVAMKALDEGDVDKARRTLPLLSEQADRSVDLVNSLLTLARAGEGGEFEPRAVVLDEFVPEVLAQMRQEAGGVALPVTVGPLPTVRADPALLQQVFTNLVGNALKFSRGAATPRVEIGAERQPGGPVLYVRDNGVGFDGTSPSAQHLGEPFLRLHGGRFAGNGVGLSIVKRIVERHGGHLWAKSAPEQGATFFFTLGAAAAE
ncbi:MAG: HAMP domain-containing histidine kinase [Rubrivivax sp.]|nr:HAMP domain-containing histidine kinase [Rubrivivax sp.]